MDNALAASRQMSQAGDAKSAMDSLQARLQPGVQDAQAYGEQLRQIVADIQKDFQQAADTHLVEAKNTLSALIYDVTQNVKPGQENAVEIIKAAIDNAFQGYEQVTQSTREAMRRVEEQVSRATSQLAAGQAPKG
jgi:hypothetical protein